MFKRTVTIIFFVGIMITTCGTTYATNGSLSDPTSQEAYTMRFAGMTKCSVYLTIQSGQAVPQIVVDTNTNKADKVSFSVNLQQYKNGTWVTIKTWSQTKTVQGSDVAFVEYYKITKKYKYRYTGTVETYKSGAVLDTLSITSKAKTY